MTAITVGSRHRHRSQPASGQAREAGPVGPRLGRVRRSRMQQAEREIALHRHLLPAQLQTAGERLARSEKDLPFVR